MAMDAKQAASLVKSNNFEDVDALYTALNGNDEYEKEFAALLKYIDAKVKMDMLRYTGMADAAEAVDKLDEKTNPLDEKDAAYAEMRAKLDKIELYETVEENGKQVTRVATGAARDQAIARLVDAAKLEAKSELRGGSNTEFPSAKKFANAKDDKEREAIYQKTLNEKMDLAILQSFLAGESAKISQEMQEKYKGDEVKAQNEFKKKITKRSKEIKKKIAELGQSASAKLELAVDGIVGYCADAAQRAENQLIEYKHNVKKLSDRINQGFAKLKDKGRDLRGKWQTVRTNANRKFENCNRKMANGIASFNESCKKVWDNRYEIARNVVKTLDKKKYEIGADVLAAAGFALTVSTGGTAALVGGAAYAAYTVGRRVFYEAYKQKKENPDKSYKDIYKNPKFVTKAVFSVAAAGLSMGIASQVAAAGADVATQTATEIAKQLATQKAARRAATIGGSVTSNLVGVATAKDKDERKKEWKSLGWSALGAGVAMFATELCSDGHAAELSPKDLNETETPVAADTVAKGDSVQIQSADEQLPTAENQNPVSVEDEFDGPVMQPFPEEWNKDMGISKRQFDILKSWYEKLDTTDGAGMARFYSHADYYAKELSVDPENPMTAEQVLFKFSRLAAITSVKSGEYGTIGTGSLGTQLEDIYHLLGCGDQLTAEQMEVARKTLDICTLNEAGRADGRMDAAKFFAVAGAGYRGLPVDEDGTLTMTRRIRVIGEGTDCPEDKRVMYEEVPEPEHEPEPVPVRTPEPRIEPVAVIRSEARVGEDLRLELEGDDRGGGDEVVKVEEEKDKYIAGATSQTGDRPGIDGARAAQNLQEGSPEAEAAESGSKKRKINKMLKELREKGIEI